MFEEWRRAQPNPDVAVAAGEATASDAASPEAVKYRNMLAETVSARRKTTFALGRIAARQAAAGVGHDLGDLPVGDSGAPTWPAGLVGSIAHTDLHGIALVGRTTSVGAVGVDIERLAPRGDIERLVAFDAELDWVAAGDADRRTLELFSAKEAIFKAVYPTVGVRFGFDAVRLEADVPGPDFVGRFVTPVASGHDIAAAIDVWTRWAHDVVVAWVVLAP